MSQTATDNLTATPPMRPLFVDLDGTLVATDTLHESLLEIAGRRPDQLPRALLSLTGGRTKLKAVVGELTELDPAALPYREEALELIRQAKDEGRPVVLASASWASTVQAVADHLDLFDAVIATNDDTNLKGQAKLDAMRRLMADRGWGDAFDYAGDSLADLPIWAEAETAHLAGASRSTRRQAKPKQSKNELGKAPPNPLIELLRACRPHQWSKNLLLAVPMIASQQLGSHEALLFLLYAFAAFSLCASAVYLLNDLLDLRADRLHPTKRKRPIAAGRLAPINAALGMIGLLVASLTISAALLPTLFTQILVCYFVLTTAYSLHIKGKVMLDVLWLASLYTVRIVAGGAAVDILPSQWLLGFSMFAFLSLAFVKRFCELSLMLRSGKERATGRGYHTQDLGLVQTMGVGSGYLAVLIFAMYINSDAVRAVYQTPEALWLACPMLLYWISRMWLLAQRGQLKGDPLLFALSDRTSYFCLALLALVIALAQYAS